MDSSNSCSIPRVPLAMAVAAAAALASQALLVSASHAQDQAQPKQNRVLEEVTVTARRVEESIQDVPTSIVPLTQEALEQNQVVSVFDLPQITPGLTVMVNSQGAAPTFAIRAAKADNGTSDTVTAYVDDVPVAWATGITNMMYDLQSVSVLKGPQGTYFGTSTTGGAIIFRPNKPTDEFEGYIGAGGGDYSLFTSEGMVNVPISDTVQLRIAGDYYDRGDGFVENHTPGTPSNLSDDEHYSGRATLRLQPSDSLLNDTEVDYFKADHNINQEVLVALREPYMYRTFLGGLEVPVSYEAAGISVPGGTGDVEIGPFPTWYESEMTFVSNTTSFELNENVSFKNILSYQKIDTDTAQDNDATVQAVVNGRTANNVEFWSEELSMDWATSDNRFRQKIGAFISNKQIDTGNHYRVLDLPFNLAGYPPQVTDLIPQYYPIASISKFRREFDSYAVYSQLGFEITDTWTLTLGGRYTWDEGDYHAEQRQVLGADAVWPIPFGVFTGPYPCSGAIGTYKNYNPEKCTGTQDLSDSAATGLASLEGHFGDHMVYLSYHHGYLVGGFNNGVSVPEGQVFDPEKVDDVELGLKSDWTLFDAPIRSNIAVYYGEYKDQQRVQSGQDPTTGQTYIAVGNAGSTTFYGWDVDITYQPLESLTLALGWNHVNSEYDEFDAPLNMPNVGTEFISLAGDPTAQTPPDIVTASATYVWPLGSDWGEVSSTLSWSWRDSTAHHDSPQVICDLDSNGECFPQNITESFTAWDDVDSYALTNFSTLWSGMLGSNFDLRAWVKNLADEEYEVYGSNQMVQYGYANYYYGEPRTWGVNVTYNF